MIDTGRDSPARSVQSNAESESDAPFTIDWSKRKKAKQFHNSKNAIIYILLRWLNNEYSTNCCCTCTWTNLRINPHAQIDQENPHERTNLANRVCWYPHRLSSSLSNSEFKLKLLSDMSINVRDARARITIKSKYGIVAPRIISGIWIQYLTYIKLKISNNKICIICFFFKLMLIEFNF